MRNSLKSVCKLIQASQSEVPVEQQFLTDLKRSIELTDLFNARTPSKTYKPSSMNCMRNMYYQRLGVEVYEDSTAELIGICESGSDRHERLQAAVSEMKNNGMDCEYIDVADYINSRNIPDIEIVKKQGYETKLYHNRLIMSFLCDGIIRYHGKYYILEIKTESVYKWINRDRVADAHINQATAYSLALGIPQVLFVYVNRDTCGMKAFMLNVSDADRERVQNTIIECEKCVLNKKLPDKPEGDTKKLCQYCAYKKYCESDYSG